MGTHEREYFSWLIMGLLLGCSSILNARDDALSYPVRLLLVAYWAEKTESPLLSNYLEQLNSSLESRASQLSQDIANLQISQSEQE